MTTKQSAARLQNNYRKIRDVIDSYLLNEKELQHNSDNFHAADSEHKGGWDKSIAENKRIEQYLIGQLRTICGDGVDVIHLINTYAEDKAELFPLLKRMDADQWTEIQPYGKEGYKWWISGIYKIVSYGEGEYSAFYIVDGQKNWGDYVSPPPHNGKYGKIWNSLEAAMEACSKHATSHSPKPSTQQRAAFLKQHFVNQANERGAA